MATKVTADLRSFLLLAAVSAAFLLLPKTSASTLSGSIGSTDFIRSSCGATLYPAICYSSLAGYAGSVRGRPGHLARAAVSVSLRRARHASAHVSALLRHGTSSLDPRIAAALRDCGETLSDAVDLMKRSLAELRQAHPGVEEFGLLMSDVETWMSAALTDEDTCTEGLEEADDAVAEGSVAAEVGDVKEVTSNALALVNSYAASQRSR